MTTPLTPTIEVCPACDHDIRSHFASVSGVVRCLVNHYDETSSGVVGIPYHVECDCTDYKSPDTEARRARIAAEVAEHDEWTQAFVARIRAARDATDADKPTGDQSPPTDATR